MLVLLVVLLVPCALVSALVRCDESWSSTAALAFAGSSALVRRSNAPPAAAEASVIGARKKERTSPVVTVRGSRTERERERLRLTQQLRDTKKERVYFSRQIRWPSFQRPTHMSAFLCVADVLSACTYLPRRQKVDVFV